MPLPRLVSSTRHRCSYPAKPWFGLLMVVFLALMLAMGCEKKDEPKAKVADGSVDVPDPLTVLVVGEPALGQRLARQWSARTDGELKIVNQAIADFESSDFALSDQVDVVIYPPGMIGELVSRNRLRVMPDDLLNSDEFNREGLLRHFRTSIIRHRSETWAVPLGSPNFAMLTNRTIFEAFDPPLEWDQMARTLTKVAEAVEADPAKKGIETKVDMPLVKGWAAQTFLARAAPVISFRGTLSTVFDRSTMDPMISTPPFVEALEQLTAIASSRSIELDPAAVFNLARNGKSSIALTWPALGFSNIDAGSTQTESENSSDAETELVDSQSPRSQMAITPLPGTDKWYDQKSKTWNLRLAEEERNVDLIGFSGLVASVSSYCRSERSAWELIEWLPSKSISKLTMVDSSVVGPFRASHLGDMIRWTGDLISEDAAFEYADVIAANHERSMVLMFPRIPGYRQYIEALDDAVRSAMKGDETPEAALAAAAKKWDEITDSIGRNKQIGNLRKEAGF